MVIKTNLILTCQVNAYFLDLLVVTHIKSHTVTSGSYCVSSLVAFCTISPIHDITYFSVLIRHLAGYSVQS